MTRPQTPAMTVPIVTDSVTLLPTDCRGRAALAASHGGTYAELYELQSRSDAGATLDEPAPEEVGA